MTRPKAYVEPQVISFTVYGPNKQSALYYEDVESETYFTEVIDEFRAEYNIDQHTPLTATVESTGQPVSPTSTVGKVLDNDDVIYLERPIVAG